MHSAGFLSESIQPSAKVPRENAALAGIKFRKGQKTTPARGREGRDLRNMATMAAANSLYGDVPMQLMGNVDAPGLRGGHQADTADTAHREEEGTCGEEASSSPHESWASIDPVPYLFATGDPEVPVRTCEMCISRQIN